MSSTIQLPAGSPGAQILGVGEYRPRRRVTNDELSQTMDTSDEWISSRVGIRERRWARPTRPSSRCRSRPAARHWPPAASPPRTSTWSSSPAAACPPRSPAPAPRSPTASASPAPAASTSTPAAPGFCYALAAASDSIRAGSARNALVIGVEKLTDVVDMTDRSTAVIFADGAARWCWAPATSPASARWSGVPTATSATPSPSPCPASPTPAT